MNLDQQQLEKFAPPATRTIQGLLSLDEVATTLGVSAAWVRDHATRRSPRLPVVRLGGKRAILRFRVEDVENFITAHLSVQQGGV
jgi:predicted DNA-binding transcriptional regulator AlpA